MATTLVYQGGPLGTPSSGDLSNCTGGGGGGGLAEWDSGTTYHSGDIVVDRGGLWKATGTNDDSQPISGNTDWTLVGGTPYVDVAVTPPLFSSLGVAPGVFAIPAPGAGLWVLPRFWMSATSSGEPWNNQLAPLLFWTRLDNTQGLDAFNGALLEGGAAVIFGTESSVGYGVDLREFTVGSDYPAVENLALYLFMDSPPEGGSRTVTYRIFYTILPVDTPASASFFNITAVVQVAKTFTVTDADADLSGATGTFEVVGSTGNNATYTIVSAISGAGDTVITVVEAIPDATADGWVKFA